MAAERRAAPLVEPVEDARPASSPDGRSARTWPSLLLVVGFVVGFVLVSLVVLVRGRLLEGDLYSSALVCRMSRSRHRIEIVGG
jgi:hypothetical protein